jgi:hypothetical protein
MKRSIFSISGTLRFFAGFFFISLFVGCVSIKPSTVQLSVAVGERLSEMEKIHQLAIQKYFDMEKQKVEDFLTNTWEPQFLKNFLGTSQVLDMLQNVSKIDDRGRRSIKSGISRYLTDTSEAERATKELVAKLTETRKGEDGLVRTVLTKFVENNKLDAAVIHVSSLLGTDEPARIILDFAEAAHEEMLAQRKEMLAPIEQARAEAVASLSEAYAELIRGQSTITGRLEAAARRSKQQDELLNKLGVGQVPKELVDKMTDITNKVNKGLGAANTAVKKLKDGEGVISAFKDAFK